MSDKQIMKYKKIYRISVKIILETTETLHGVTSKSSLTEVEFPRFTKRNPMCLSVTSFLMLSIKGVKIK